MDKIKCNCGKEFWGMEGKEDTCPQCLKGFIKGSTINKTIIITIEGGCVTDVSGLPDGYDYELNDLDDQQ